MASRERRLLSEHDLNLFKEALAHKKGIDSQVKNGYWGEINSNECGKIGGAIGGSMVKVMIREVEKQMSLKKQR